MPRLTPKFAATLPLMTLLTKTGTRPSSKTMPSGAEEKLMESLRSR
eukprot:CAMPEP_0204544956 /NCGR_PEP_ID=MMETSP0661-20131031/20913_1 /ASSEMBLY_ACC=CAM_ASM_000606 /TAXON_ID=109239 /ORGANISM="Alexandrium margalefi, Strain AMGDE01CS-322" /LENGTH=45 /DNA_ID= /DNA_START= /DNA_END= /DNA_ORIENTATION=